MQGSRRNGFPPGLVSDIHFDVAIVGGGFSGVMTAVHLLRQCPPMMSILLIERSETLGCGLAFGTATPGHLLNVPVRSMSAFHDDSENFLHWLRRHKDPEASAGAFVSRQWYGEYVASLLTDQLHEPGSASLRCVRGEVASIEGRGETLNLFLTDSSRYHSRFVVLAIGNFPPLDPVPLTHLSSHCYARYAWSPEALNGIADSDSILLVGSGLTAIDQVVTLEEHGFKGKIYMLSRRGLLPAIHRDEPAWPAEWTNELPASMKLLVSEVRGQVWLARSRRIGWRAVVDSLRPVTPRIWKSLDIAERRRFLRHVRCFWEIHRHRMSPEIGRLLEELRRVGRLVVQTGRVLSCTEHDGYVEVAYRARETSQARLLRVSRIVNCTGHETDARKIDSPVVRSLLNNNLARVDASLLGLDVTEEGAVIDASGNPSRSLFALGSVRKGLLWESTAVPEIRVQVQCLAERLAGELANCKRGSAAR